ncbi:hypothetical protein LX15_004099 [Streptoalloteichus tenebrarius]|uniref:Transposase n=1 Tax=Streptoalloteichus tenebrarius (strain ATCC 17920 / DSM 40477 / JCM 4838 / CBS 697.72 / NBRC 16177 / NCIMB 11028 / NRRL B-12390 / A12253. 1 / ISP 5477) TaxID=1933 RepID=A0ABT1HY15_STRSD|nr:hypothetical protein [Streptoalloteichus tenebrarius]BFF02508.1 hypothetical protein GCM10020241_41830 [Streptoalloteichus tenebrarius]
MLRQGLQRHVVKIDARLRMTREEALREIDEVEAAHLLYRTWAESPPSGAETRQGIP